jgi:hypothetical protein
LFLKKPSIASGATSIGSVTRIPDEKKRKEIFIQDMTMQGKQGANIFESIPEKVFSTIASGATPIGSAGRASDKIADYTTYGTGVGVYYQIPCQQVNFRHLLFVKLLPSGGVFD